MKVILCVGETLSERNTLKIAQTLKDQIDEALRGLYENELENITVAYEPIWAIGSGKTPLNKEIDQAGKIIRKVIAEGFSQAAGEKVEVLYGGSANIKNASSICKCKNIDGLLIGGACLDANGFLQIMTSLPQ